MKTEDTFTATPEFIININLCCKMARSNSPNQNEIHRENINLMKIAGLKYKHIDDAVLQRCLSTIDNLEAQLNGLSSNQG